MKREIKILYIILTLFFLVILFILPSCAKRQDERYVSAIAGLNIRTLPSKQGQIVDLLPFRSKIVVLEQKENYEEISGIKGKWTRIKCTIAPQCWVFGAYIENDPPTLFYRVEATVGLNLRAEPNLKGSIIVSLPYRTIGSVDTIKPHLEIIENKRGFWFRTTFNNKVGWIYSGFTTTSRNEYELSGDWVYNPEFKDLPELKDSLWKDGRILKSVDIGNFIIQEIEYPTVHDALMIAQQNKYAGDSIDYCNGPESRVVFLHKNSGRAYSQDGYAEWIERVDHPIKGILVTSGHGCWCCCPYPISRQYLIEEDRVIIIDLLLGQNPTASCNFSNDLFGTNVKSFIDARLTNNSILIEWKKPECNLTENQKLQIEQGETVTFENVQNFSHRAFVRLEKKEDGFRLKKIFDINIPEEFSQEWNEGKKLEWLPRTNKF